MSWIMVDVEADGPIAGDYSMVALGAVKVEPQLTNQFYAELHPISDHYQTEALNVCKFTREQTMHFEDPFTVMQRFSQWLDGCGTHLFFVSDNTGFDWGYVNWYFHHFLGKNPFGFSSTDLNSLYKGLERDVYLNFKHLRKKEPSHNALDDALMNAEILLKLKDSFDLKINL